LFRCSILSKFFTQKTALKISNFKTYAQKAKKNYFCRENPGPALKKPATISCRSI
jgi:hypothetical protein